MRACVHVLGLQIFCWPSLLLHELSKTNAILMSWHYQACAITHVEERLERAMVLCENLGIRSLVVVNIGNNLNVPFW